MMALWVARPLFPSESAAQYGDGLSMVMLWIALGIFWLLGAIGRPRFTLRFGWTDAAVLLLLGWHTVAALWATRHGTPRPAVNMLWEWIGLGLGFLLARQFIVTSREARAVAAVMVALAVAVAGYGLYQYVYEMPETRARYAADPDRAMRDAGLWYPSGSPDRERFEIRLQNREPIATFALTNSLAAFLAPWLVILAGMARGCGRNRKRLLCVALCAAPIIACLLLTKSRSGYIAAGVGLVLVWLTCRERAVRIRWKWLAAIAAVAIGLVAVGLKELDHDLLARASKSFGYRLQYWQSSWQMIGDHPLVGCGPGNFQNAYTRYKLPEASEEVADPHNFLLEIWATAGTPAMLAFLAVLARFAAEGGRRRAEGGEKSGRCAASSGQTIAAPDASMHVLVGGALGFLLSVPIGMLSAAPPGAVVIYIGLPLAAATIGLLWGWIREGRWSTLLPAVGVVVLLVDLVATGGIGLPSVAGTLWLLLALGLQGEPPHELRLGHAWAALAVAVGLAVACYYTAYDPVLTCLTQLRMAQRQPLRAVEHLEAAAAADPLSAEPWRQLASVYFQTWRQSPDEETFRRFQQADSEALGRAPNSAVAWLAAGDWHAEAASKMDRNAGKLAAETLEQAAAAYRQAVSLYPNSAVYRAKLAETLLACGDKSAFRREAQLALQLDDATPHADRKLPAALRDRLSRGPGGSP
jgi:cytochrome c-type biogenesis protein CcmH/NrfG